MPDLEEFKGHVHVSASIVDQAAGGKEEGTYIMHGVRGVPYGLDFRSRFDVLRFGNPGGGRLITSEGWYWQSLPLPPFAYGSHQKAADLIISYTVVEDGRTICLSSMFGESRGTYCFDTAKGEWWKAGDWELPFHGGVVYVPDLKFWLGFSFRNKNLCATSGLSDMALNQPPKLQLLWQNNLIPAREFVAIKANLLNLGSGKFAIAKVFKFIGESRYFSDWDMAEDEFVVLTGLGIFWDNNLQGLQTIQHKSIRYMCDNNRILQVL